MHRDTGAATGSRAASPGLRALATPLRRLKGIGPKRAAELERFGLLTVEDLLYHLPFRYEDRRRIRKIAESAAGENAVFVGRIGSVRTRFNPRMRSMTLQAVLKDDSGAILLYWYRAPGYLSDRLKAPGEFLVSGRVEAARPGLARMVHPECELLEGPERAAPERIIPVYRRPGGIPMSMLKHWIRQALDGYGACLPETLAPTARKRLGLVPLQAALDLLHNPGADADVAALDGFATPAHRAVIFAELYVLQLGLMLRRAAVSGVSAFRAGAGRRELIEPMRRLLPFSLTAAQERAVREIAADLAAERPMQRMLQGDVGAGKTMVAWLSSLRMIEAGFQVVWMAPTEMLAEQHCAGVMDFARKLGIEIALLKGSLPAPEKRNLLDRLAQGAVDCVIATHAVIQEGVRVPRLGFCVIDEQHRFGVGQRLALQRLLEPRATARLERLPHTLLMSATPIPRSLAMGFYGDLDMSVLDELPPGRAPIVTRVCLPADRGYLYETLLAELQRGRQAYVVYPRIDSDDDETYVRSAGAMAEKMTRGPLGKFGIGLVHGKMPREANESAMRSFRDGRIGVLVATTIIEVGIDVPNATLMIVEHAERFGLSQLHQLRGRVGRGAAQSHCLLVHRAPGQPAAEERLRILERERDGFKIAEADLLARGPGEFLGMRQSGRADFRLANLLRDQELLQEARDEAAATLERDPRFESAASGALRRVVLQRWGQRLQLGGVG